MVAPDFEIDFEGGTDGNSASPEFDAVSNTPEYYAAGAIHGSMAMLCDGDAADYGVIAGSMPSTPTEGWWQIYGRLSAAPGGNSSFLEFRKSAGSQGCELQLNTSAQIRIRDDSAVAQGTTTAALNADGAPFRIDVRVLSDATAGEVEVRMSIGSNFEGAIGAHDDFKLVTGIDTGAGTLHSFAIGWIVNPGNGADFIFDSIRFSASGWIDPKNPAATTVKPVFGVPQATYAITHGPAYSSILVPATGALFGASTARSGVAESSHPTGLIYYNSIDGGAVRPPDSIGIYKVGNWDGTFTSNELAMLADSGNGDPAIAHVRWKIGNTGSPNSWASVAAGDCNAVIDTAGANLAAYGLPVMISIYHEPEDNAGPTGYSNQDWVDMQKLGKDRLDAQGATNLIYCPNFMGYYGHIDHVTAMMEGLAALTGTYFHWVGQDPYTNTTDSRDTWAELVNWDPSGLWAAEGPGYDGFYDYIETEFPGTPQKLPEFGVDGGPNTSNTAPGDVDEDEAVVIFEEYPTGIRAFPMIKWIEIWHATGTGDYQIPDRSVGGPEYAAFTNDSYFDQDTSVALGV